MDRHRRNSSFCVKGFCCSAVCGGIIGGSIWPFGATLSMVIIVFMLLIVSFYLLKVVKKQQA